MCLLSFDVHKMITFSSYFSCLYFWRNANYLNSHLISNNDIATHAKTDAHSDKKSPGGVIIITLVRV